MTCEQRPLTVGDLRAIDPQAAQVAEHRIGQLPDEQLALAAAGGWGGWRGGRLFACAGVIEHWPGRSAAWAILAPTAGPAELRWLTWRIRRFLDEHPATRVETTVRMDFPAGHRWAGLLGFDAEGILRAYGIEGADYMMYARIKD